MNDALWHRRHDEKPNFLERESRRRQHLAKLGRDIPANDLLLSRGRDDVAGRQRLHSEASLQRMGGSLKPKIFLRRGEDHALGGLGLGLSKLDEVAGPDLGVGALKPVETDDGKAFVLAIGTDDACRSRPLADHFDDIAFGDSELGHHRPGQPGDPAATIFGPHGRDLQPPGFAFVVSHSVSALLLAPT